MIVYYSIIGEFDGLIGWECENKKLVILHVESSLLQQRLNQLQFSFFK